MSLLNVFLQGLNEGQDVWEQYRVPVGDAIDDFNNSSKSVEISKNTYLHKFYPLYSKVDGAIIGGVAMYTSLAIVKFLEIFDECSTQIAKARDEQSMPYEEIKKLDYIMRNDLKTLYCSLTIDEMNSVKNAMFPAFDDEISQRSHWPLYSFFQKRSHEWRDEKLVMSDDVPTHLKLDFMFL